MVENKRIWFREGWNFPPLHQNQDRPGQSLFALRFVAGALGGDSACKGRCPRAGRFCFSFVFARLASPWLWSWPLLWAACLHAPVTSSIMQRNQLFVFASLETVSNYMHFRVCVSNRKTPERTAERWSISFPMKVDSPSRTPCQSFLMRRKFCYLQALQKMRFEHCFQLGASKSLSLLSSFL